MGSGQRPSKTSLFAVWTTLQPAFSHFLVLSGVSNVGAILLTVKVWGKGEIA